MIETLRQATITYVFNAAWQIPLIFIAAWASARLARRLGPSVEHRIWVAALVLETLLPAARLNPAALLRGLWQILSRRWSGATPGGEVRISQSAGSVSGPGLIHLPASALEALLLLYLGALLIFVARFLWRLWRTSLLARHAEPVTLSPEARLLWERFAATLTTKSPVQIVLSPLVSGPSTIGIRNFALLLPPSFLESVTLVDLQALFAHEFAHMRRQDFARNGLYEALAIPISFHPLVWLTRARLAETREMICDALAAKTEGSQSYAHSLLHMASITLLQRQPNRSFHAVGIFDANIFERRIMSLTSRNPAIKTPRRLLTLAACALIAVATCGSAMALHVNIGTQEQDTAGQVPISGGIMAGQVLSKVPPVYPVKAKADKDTLDGAVVLAAVIGKDGSVESLQVVRSLRQDYDESAIDAVSGWKYKPYLLNGEPVTVKTTITINYSLAR